MIRHFDIMLNVWGKAFKENNRIQTNRNDIDSLNIPILKKQTQNTTSRMKFHELKGMRNNSYICFPVRISKSSFI